MEAIKNLYRLLPSKWKPTLMVFCVLSILSTPLVSAGYQIRKFEMLGERLETVEASAKQHAIIESDVQWLKRGIEENNQAHRDIYAELRAIRQILMENAKDAK